MLGDTDNQISIYSILYNKIPQNHILKLINENIDLSFVTKLLEKSYNKDHGRPAKSPELMIRLLILQHLYNLSNIKVIEESSLNLARMYFLGINPEEDLSDPSLLAKFRVHRLQDITLDEIIVEIVRQCVEKGIIKDNGISIDATHTEANTFKAIPERVIKRLATKIFKTYKKEVGQLPENINQDIPNYKKIENHKEARVGHKSKTVHLFGYKTEFIMTTDERIITSVTVDHGAYADGTDFERLMNLTKKTGLTIEEVYGDKAYFRKPILDKIDEVESKAYIPVGQSVYRIDEENYSYNKNSDVGLNTSTFYLYSQEQKTEEFKEKLVLFNFIP